MDIKYINRLTASQNEDFFKLLDTDIRSVESKLVFKEEIICIVDFYCGEKCKIENIILTDFEAKGNNNDKNYTIKLRNYLYSIFGEEYKNDLKEYLHYKKEKIFENAIQKAKAEADEIQEEIDQLSV